jgi:hypothetical protein
LACEIAAARHFNLDHIGAEEGELVAGERAGENVCQVQYADPREQ